MNCPQCGEILVPDAKFCHHCGATLAATPPVVQPQPIPSPPVQPQPPTRQGRGGLVLVLGILAIVMFGPLTGIPAWVMGHGDLKLIRAGIISQHEHGMTMAGMVLGIIGTAIGAIVIIGIIVAIGIAMMSIRGEFSMLISSVITFSRLS